MKRLLTMLFLIVCIVTPAATEATWPEQYQGDRIPEGCYDIQAEVVDWHDMNPWGMHSPVGLTAVGELCVDADVATFQLTHFGEMSCDAPPWSGGSGEPVCTMILRTKINVPPRVLPWNGGSYLVQIVDVSEAAQIISKFEALTYDHLSGDAVFTEGALLYIPPLFYEDHDGYTRTTWAVSQLTAPVAVATSTKK